jgi:hypothetical protein
MVVWLHCYGPEVVRQNIMQQGIEEECCIPHGGQEAESQGGIRDKVSPLTAHPQW